MQKERPEFLIDQELLRTENAALRKKLHDLESRTSALEASCEMFDLVVEAAQAGYWDWNIESGELVVNEKWASLLGYALDELEPITIKTWKEQCHPDDLPLFNQLFEVYVTGHAAFYELELRMRHKQGHWVWVLYRGKVFERDIEGNPIRMVGSHQDISLQKNSEYAHTKSMAFERLVTSMFNQFINLPFEHINAIINNTLRLIGEFVEADRSYIFQFRDNLRFMDNTHEWCAENIEPAIDTLKELPTSCFPWWMKQIRNNTVIHIPRTADMTDESSAEKEILASHGIKSLIVVPLITGSIPFGYIGFDAVKQEKHWHSEAMFILKLAGGIIANALQREQVEHFIQAELDLAIKLNRSSSVQETLQTCLHAAILASGLDCGGIYLVNKHEGTIILAIHEGLPKSFINHSSSYSFDSENARLILKGKPMYHKSNDPVSNKRKTLGTEQLTAIASLPITYRDEVIACLNVASHTLSQIPEFSRKGLETITSHIGSAIMQARQEEEIAEAKSNLESLFDTIDDLLFIIDNNGKVIHTNAAVTKKLGYTAKTIHDKHVLHFHPEEQWDIAKNNIEEMLAGNKGSSLIPFKTNSGNLIPVETKITRGIWNKKPVLFGISRDFSERILSEKTLRESEKRFRELTELLPLALFETDLSGTITYTNKKCFEGFGYTPEDTNQKLFALNFCIPQDAKKAMNNVKAIKQGRNISEEYTALRKNGSTFPAHVYSLPIIQNGQVNGVRSLVVDLTELKEAEQALRTSEVQKRIVQEFKALIDNIPGAVYRTNDEGKTTMLSMISDVLLDYTKEEFEDELFETGAIIHPEDRDTVSASNQALRSVKTSQTLYYRIIMKNGTVKWLEDRKTSVFSRKNIFTGIDGILFDITERIMAQKENQQLESSLRKAQRLETIGTLAGGIAHDFNNILTPILGYAEMGVLSLDNDESQQEYFNEIIQAAERAKNLVAQILTFSKTEESTHELVSVQEIVDEALKLLRPSIPSIITIEKQLDNTCRNILGDPSQIHQVIINLCTNAFQAMEESGGLLTIKLKEIIPDSGLLKQLPKPEAESYVKLSISDTGTGMDERTIERIFEPFFTTKSVNKGTGLGLSVVHGIITSFKGVITVDSQSEKGATFSVYLPVVNEQIMKAAKGESCTKGYGHILFVDDEPTVLKMMTMMITKLGFKTQALSSSLQALELFRQNPERFDLVITDLTMPEMTGAELAEQIHKTNPQLPIILMTGYGKAIETIPLSQYGICKYLKKPIKLAEMAATINDVLFRNIK
jgi:two-component system cell cycle sensor histidine kinase/response regulator CckA